MRRRLTPVVTLCFLLVVPCASAQTSSAPPDPQQPPNFSDTVEVVGAADAIESQPTLAPVTAVESRALDQFVPGQAFQGALRLLPAVMPFSNGVSIKGGRVNQAAIQLEAATLIDPSSGVARVSLPDGAIESVTVLPNPYAVEYGRFSSGLIVVQSRRARDRWKLSMNKFGPSVRTTNDGGLRIDAYNPRFEVGGPVVKDRLFLHQSMQMNYRIGDQSSIAESAQRVTKSVSTFTRADASLTPRHLLVTTVGIFPAATDFSNVGTFTPPEASVNIHVFGKLAAVTERAVWSSRTLSETTFQWYESRTDVDPQGSAPMQLQPDLALGNYFNRQHRLTSQFQFVQTVTAHRTVGGKSHALKAGIDLLHAAYDGTSRSSTLLIERADATVARRLEFSGESTQAVSATEAALFAQDRVQITPRWHVETGVRLDRDGVLGTINLSPRIGTAVRLDDTGNVVVRGGFGLFVERTPSTAGAFTSFETAIDTRYPGSSLQSSVSSLQSTVSSLQSTVFSQRVTQTVAPDLETPRSRTWDAAFDYRWSERWALHLGALSREGRHELIVTPTGSAQCSAGPQACMAERRLSSDGQSSYRDVEVGVHYTRGTLVDIDATYTRSKSEGDLNALASTFDSVLAPIIGENVYAPLGTDVPHRLLVTGRVMPRPKWLVLGILDWHTGVPYSIVDEMLDYIGPRNALRFPVYSWLELGIERRFKIFRWQPWIGVRAGNALGLFLPTDVQNNTGSPNFGTFYNSDTRRIRGSLRFER
jgi:hypothetical protein